MTARSCLAFLLVAILIPSLAHATEEQVLARVSITGQTGPRSFDLVAEMDDRGSLIGVGLREDGASQSWPLEALRAGPRTLATAPAIGDTLKASVRAGFRADVGGEANFEILSSWFPRKRWDRVQVRLERIGRWTLYNLSTDGRAFNRIDVRVGLRSASFSTSWR